MPRMFFFLNKKHLIEQIWERDSQMELLWIRFISCGGWQKVERGTVRKTSHGNDVYYFFILFCFRTQINSAILWIACIYFYKPTYLLVFFFQIKSDTLPLLTVYQQKNSKLIMHNIKVSNDFIHTKTFSSFALACNVMQNREFQQCSNFRKIQRDKKLFIWLFFYSFKNMQTLCYVRIFEFK